MAASKYIARCSGAPIWGHCAAAVMAMATRPSIETAPNRIGTAAHWVGSETLEAWYKGAPRSAYDLVGTKAPNGVVIDEDMAAGAAVYVEDCLSVFREVWEADNTAYVLVEHEVHASGVHQQCGGTADFIVVAPKLQRIVTSDYKHGHGLVRAQGNEQLTCYTDGVMQALQINGLTDRFWTVQFRVVQPNCFQRSTPVDVWDGRLCDLRGDINRLTMKVEQGLQQNPKATPGAHCRYCPARVDCQSAVRFSAEVAEYCSGPADFVAFDGRNLALEHEFLASALKVIKTRFEAVDDELIERIRAGDATTGKALQSVEGSRTYWHDDVTASQVVAIGRMFDADFSKPGAKTPKQCLDAVSPKKREAIKAVLKGKYYRKTSTQLIDASETFAARTFQKQEN